MAFQPGHKKVGGRTKGTPNKATVQARELARDLLGPRYLARLRQRLLAGEAGGMESLLWQYAFGRPGTEAISSDRADAAELFETLLTRLERPQSPADQQAPRRAQVRELRSATAASSKPA